MNFNVGEFRVAVREAGADRGAAKVVGIVAVDRAVHLVEIIGVESVRLRRRKHCSLICTSELDICCYALGDVERVECYVAGVVVRKESGGDDGHGDGI